MKITVITFTDAELEQVRRWYLASAGESAHEPSHELFSLLEKLGFEADQMDLSLVNPDNWVEDFRPIASAQLEAQLAYLERHPELKEK